MLKLKIDSGGTSTVVLTVGEGTHLVGRRAECQIRIANDTVSNRHAELTVGGGRAVLRDLASTGGLFVNAEQVRQVVLKKGDVIKLGTALVEVLDCGGPEA